MKRTILLFLGTVVFLSANSSAQTSRPVSEPSNPPAFRSSDAVENISNDVARMTRAVEALSRSWAEFTKTFSSNQGLQLDERQRSLILALEVLNRVEVSLSNMQKLRLDLIERQSRMRIQLATVTDDLLPQSIDRYVALRGTTDAEGLRDIRRQALSKEHRELTLVLTQIERELRQTDDEIRRTELQIRGLRSRIFGEVERQLADF